MSRTQDMRKLAIAFFQNLQRDNCEYGGIGLDSKRPFGNSDVEGDILEIIGQHPPIDCYTDEQRAYATGLYYSLIEYLQEQYLPTRVRKAD